MKRLIGIALVVVFALSFVAGLLTTPAQASDIPMCPVYCDDGILYACEPVYIGQGGHYKCICQAVGYCF